MVPNTFLCLHVSNGKDDIWGKPMLGCVHWNFLMRISTIFLRMTCKSCILQWFRSSFTAKTDPSILMLHLKKTGHSVCPCLALWIWITAPVFGLILISLISAIEMLQANSLWKLWWSLLQRFVSTHSARFPSMPVPFGSSNQIACRCVLCVCQQQESVFWQLWFFSMKNKYEIPLLLYVIHTL